MFLQQSLNIYVLYCGMQKSQVQIEKLQYYISQMEFSITTLLNIANICICF